MTTQLAKEECPFVVGTRYKDRDGREYEFLFHEPRAGRGPNLFLLLSNGAVTPRTDEGYCVAQCTSRWDILPSTQVPPFEKGKKYKTVNGNCTAEFIGTDAANEMGFFYVLSSPNPYAAHVPLEACIKKQGSYAYVPYVTVE